MTSFYVITNRQLHEDKQGLDMFGDTPNSSGPKELRLVHVTQASNGSWSVNVEDDKLDDNTVKSLKRKYRLPIDIKADWYASLRIACDLFEQASEGNGKPILFFVHGYNNDIEDVLQAAKELQEAYGVIAVPISWPANGGGVRGLASYLSDKSDARVSSSALDRVIEKIHAMHTLLTHAQTQRYQQLAERKYPDNPQAQASYYSKLLAENCRVKINLLCHSMGNYVFKHTFATSENHSSETVFDNVCLVAADTNLQHHEDWVEKIDAKNRVYIVINKNDYALAASRIKPGKAQRARLGHSLNNLKASNAAYIDVTGVDGVDNDHGYFKGDAIKNAALKAIFTELFCGESAEHLLKYHAQNNSFRLLKGG